MNLTAAIGILFLIIGHSYLVRDGQLDLQDRRNLYAGLGAALLSCSIA